MNPTLEKVARAICENACIRQKIGLPSCLNPDLTNGPCQANHEQLGTAISAAERALRALLPPSEEVVEAMAMAVYRSGYGNEYREEGVIAFTAAIQSVLKEGEG